MLAQNPSLLSSEMIIYLFSLFLFQPMIYGLRSEVGVCELIQSLVRYSQYYHGISGCYYFDITKNGQIVSKWSKNTLILINS